MKNAILLLALTLLAVGCQAARDVATNTGEAIGTLLGGADVALVETVRDGLIGFGSTGDLGAGATALVAGQLIWNKIKASKEGSIVG